MAIIWTNRVESGRKQGSLGLRGGLRRGHRLPAEHARAYVLREIETGPQTFADLWANAQKEWPKVEGAYRAIDRALSYWKRGGVIAFDRGRGCWRKVE